MVSIDVDAINQLAVAEDEDAEKNGIEFLLLFIPTNWKFYF